LQRQRLLLLARLAVAIQDEADLQTRLADVAPLMAEATELERHQYLRLISGLLLSTDPRRVLRLTDLDPVPPILLRVRARALLELGEIDAAEQLLRASLDRADVGRLQRLGIRQALVSALVDGDQAVDAERESQQLIDAARPLLGADSRAMLGYWNTRAIALAAAGHLEEAVEALDALLNRPDLSAGLRTPLELNRILFGSAMRTPDATTAALLDRYWSERESLRFGAKRILLLARIRQRVRDRQMEAARGEMALARELLEGTSIESRLLRQWAHVLGLSALAGSIEASTETLRRMDPQLAALESLPPVR
jgi:tetratricopeptide (TPR) repeat protein